MASQQSYRLKLDALNLKEGEKREVEVEGIEKGKVLLVKLNGKTHAMSPNCTHYGAPMVKAVLSPMDGGRLTCPWHGACFSVETGDVEDAPALDPLAKFPIEERDGVVYIKGSEEVIKASRVKTNLSCKKQGQEHVVIVGGGSGTAGALEGLRRNGYKGAITVLSREPNLPIDRTKLSKALIADESKLALRPAEWYKESSIDLVHEEVTAVDFGVKQVSTKAGKTYPYTKLILATGGTPRRLPTEGLKDLNNVFVLRSLQDAQDIVSAVGEANRKKVVVIGSSFIGMEVANALASKGNTVSVIGTEKYPLQRVMGEQVGKIFQAQLEKKGVVFYMEGGAEKATPSAIDSSKVGAVHLKGGKQLEADLVVLGVGVAPATEFLKNNSAVQLEKDGSLRTNEKFEVTGLKDVFAIGDIATYPYHGPGGNGTPTRIEHWNVAQNAGRSVGYQLSTGSTKAKQFIPIFWSAMGSQLRYCGNTSNGFEDIVMTGKPDEGKFAAYYTKGDQVVAVATMGMDPYMSHSAELMRRGSMPSKSEIKAGLDILEVVVPSEIVI